MTDVKALTQVVAGRPSSNPTCRPLFVDGDPNAVARLDAMVRSRVLDDTTVRVKLWDDSGRIVYSDEPRLIGETYELDEDHRESLWNNTVVSEVSSLDGPENRFENHVDQMLEVYLPIDGPDGVPLLYESYFTVDEVTHSATRIRAEFLPITVGALGVMEAMHLGLAFGLTRRMRRNQRDRERLLQRAINSSDIERRRIAADLHDSVVQELVGASFAVSAAVESASRADADNPELVGRPTFRGAGNETQPPVTSVATGRHLPTQPAAERVGGGAGRSPGPSRELGNRNHTARRG